MTGASGSGKSRLLRALADLDPASGDVRLEGVPREAMSPAQWRARVMLVPSESHWWADRVGDHFTATPSAAMLAALDLATELLARPPGDVSAGERQRLGVLRALVREPSVLLLDEPTANLDTDNAARMEALLADRRRQGNALLWVSHDPSQVRRVADRALHLTETGLAEYSPWM